MKHYFDTPWKITNFLMRWVLYPANRFLFALNGIRWGKGWQLHGMPIIQKHRYSTMRFESGFSLRSSVRSNPLGANHPVILCTWQAGATLEIGADFGMTGGSIVTASRIMIGNRVTVGANTTIVDNDFHPLEVMNRRAMPQNAKMAPVEIEDDVFIGMNCLILKGVSIGHGSIIGAGSVVAKNIPCNVVVAGNPARVIRKINT
jgi:acetyltransferase-like isoleucine patch superfamily enzyme